MKIKVKLFATFRKYVPEKGSGVSEIELPEDSRVGDVVDIFNIPEDIPRIVLVNGIRKDAGDVVSDGDTISIFPPVAGG